MCFFFNDSLVFVRVKVNFLQIIFWSVSVLMAERDRLHLLAVWDVSGEQEASTV